MCRGFIGEVPSTGGFPSVLLVWNEEKLYVSI